jgi:hypothetical protein
MAVLFTRQPSMSSQTGSLAVTAVVVRSCSFEQHADDENSVAVRCTRGAPPGVIVASSRTVVPVPPGGTVSLKSQAYGSDNEPRMVVVNF